MEQLLTFFFKIIVISSALSLVTYNYIHGTIVNILFQKTLSYPMQCHWSLIIILNVSIENIEHYDWALHFNSAQSN